MPAARAVAVLTMTDDYGRKVREIALLQCRRETGADIEADLPKVEDEDGRKAA